MLDIQRTNDIKVRFISRLLEQMKLKVQKAPCKRIQIVCISGNISLRTFELINTIISGSITENFLIYVLFIVKSF